jgi:hypothetical protein
MEWSMQKSAVGGKDIAAYKAKDAFCTKEGPCGKKKLATGVALCTKTPKACVASNMADVQMMK